MTASKVWNHWAMSNKSGNGKLHGMLQYQHGGQHGIRHGCILGLAKDITWLLKGLLQQPLLTLCLAYTCLRAPICVCISLAPPLDLVCVNMHSNDIHR